MTSAVKRRGCESWSISEFLRRVNNIKTISGGDAEPSSTPKQQISILMEILMLFDSSALDVGHVLGDIYV